MEKLFSANELLEIEKEAKLNLGQYLGTLVVQGNSTATTIETISENKQLIFTYGNEHTGFQHLRDRHAPFSFNNYWVETENESARLDKPSKFHQRMAPIIDYVKIAEAIFCLENKNITKNNRPEQFDKYTGTYVFAEGQPEKYHLLTYKDSHIVHSLFPDKKKHNPKSKAKFGKGVVSTLFDLQAAINDLVVPYENKQGIVVYSLLIRKFYSEKIERIFIQKHDPCGIAEEQYILGERQFEEFETFEHHQIQYYQFGELLDYEEIINKIDDGATEISIDLSTFRW